MIHNLLLMIGRPEAISFQLTLNLEPRTMNFSTLNLQLSNQVLDLFHSVVITEFGVAILKVTQCPADDRNVGCWFEKIVLRLEFQLFQEIFNLFFTEYRSLAEWIDIKKNICFEATYFSIFHVKKGLSFERSRCLLIWNTKKINTACLFSLSF